MPNYDFAAGIRACVKDGAGTILNKYGVSTTGGIYAGYFYGTQQCSGSGTVIVDSVGDVGGSNSIAIGTDGLPIISYYDYTSSALDLKVVKCGNNACSSGNTIGIVDAGAGGDVGGYTRIAVPPLSVPDGGGRPIIAYYDYTNTALKVAKCGNAACSSGNIVTTVDNTGETGQNLDMTLGTDGFPVISYYEAGGKDLKVLKCGNGNCNSGNTITYVDNGPNTGNTSSIAVPSDGKPAIAYMAGTSLLFVKCGNSACSSGNVFTTLEGGGGFTLDFYFVVAIGSDGLPMVFYHNINTLPSVLKVIKCGNENCNSGNIISTIDPNSKINLPSRMDVVIPSDGRAIIALDEYNAGGTLDVQRCVDTNCTATTLVRRTSVLNTWFVSVALGADGFPVISHGNTTPDDLLVTKCSDLDCTDGGSCSTQGGDIMVAGTGTITAPPIGYTIIDPNAEYVSMTKGNEGYPTIAFRDTDANQLRLIKCLNNSCTSRTNNLLFTLPASNFPDNSIAVTPADGFPLIAYFDVNGLDLWVIRCTSDDCAPGTVGAPFRIHNTTGQNNAGQHNAMTIRTDNNLPIIAYEYNGDINVISCGNAACNSGNITKTVNDGGAAADVLGAIISITIDKASGFPVIGYTGRTTGSNGFYEVSLCGNATCDSAIAPITHTKIETFGDNSNMYYASSIASDGAGSYPSIVYSTSGFYNNKLKFARCTNSSCSTRAAGNPTFLHPTKRLYASFSLGISPVGNLPVLAAPDLNDSGRLSVIKCANGECTGTNTITTVDTAVNASSGRVMFQNGTSYPTFVYTTDNTAPESLSPLKVLACVNHECTPGPGTPVGAVLKIGNTYLTKCNLIGMMRKAGITTYPACP